MAKKRRHLGEILYKAGLVQKQALIDAIEKHTTTRVNLMEVCGTHTMSIAKSGMRSMLPENLRLLSGPGCPVCVTPQETIDYAIELAHEKDITITTFGDMVRVPGTRDCLEASAPKIVYSPLDALSFASDNPKKDMVHDPEDTQDQNTQAVYEELWPHLPQFVGELRVDRVSGYQRYSQFQNQNGHHDREYAVRQSTKSISRDRDVSKPEP